ncbi:hypothetical protein HDE_04110 [Halotydeus destructor]|nr:hypothetical protein HDE_04110 [Halotydeus destructor]
MSLDRLQMSRRPMSPAPRVRISRAQETAKAEDKSRALGKDMVKLHVQLKSKVKELLEDNEKLKADLSKLTSENNLLKSTLVSTDTSLIDARKANAMLTNRNSSLSGVMSDKLEEIESLEDEIRKLTRELEDKMADHKEQLSVAHTDNEVLKESNELLLSKYN